MQDKSLSILHTARPRPQSTEESQRSTAKCFCLWLQPPGTKHPRLTHCCSDRQTHSCTGLHGFRPADILKERKTHLLQQNELRQALPCFLSAVGWRNGPAVLTSRADCFFLHGAVALGRFHVSVFVPGSELLLYTRPSVLQLTITI